MKSKPNYESRGRRAARRAVRALEEADSREEALRIMSAVLAQELRQMAAWTRRQVKKEAAGAKR